MSSALQLVEHSSSLSDTKGQTTRQKVENTLTSELIIGICAPIGSMREIVIEEIKNNLETNYEYSVEVIKLSDFISLYYKEEIQQKAGQTAPFTELIYKIHGGDQLRIKTGSSSCLVELAIMQILKKRLGGAEIPENKDINTIVNQIKSERKCYIIDSLKNKEELELLRSVYGSIFYCFSIFSPDSVRKKILNQKDLSNSEVEKLISTDEFENNTHGQNVRNTFIEGDFFIRVSDDNKDYVPQKISRYLNIIFESEIITPTPNEIAMYEAKSAAGNSACLSRQVGAAITNEKGEIISRGWNDVPKFGGNLYKDGDSEDNRCITSGLCSNDLKKDDLTEDIVKALVSDKELKHSLFNDIDITPETSLFKSIQSIIRKNSKVKDLIEFSRSVHAEMHAIIIGSQLGGRRMIDGKLFCTTYPCHNCARHIIVAGIKEIYYIEPYKKSLGTILHEDALTEDENSPNKTKILMFDGVAPRRYLEFFSLKSPRKDNEGKIIKIEKTKISPKTRLTLQSLPTLEMQSIHSLSESGLLDN
ncbi:deaminase [Mucilaginibacter roseus]|uniref:Deaminase n=1 Tax=Mucilaginibacter roseus TaxID=1528868 RepID=A0ABS8U5A9_9SPHI|nr:anti-phage dCTP deaminase [Mucilaginibacter roseus]MCD8740746.1 deaminase [Mucilaginibacter roseus]